MAKSYCKFHQYVSVGALMVVGISILPVGAQEPNVRAVIQRFPAMEFLGEKLKTSMPGATIKVDYMPQAAAIDMLSITLSSKSGAVDIMWANEPTLTKFAANGWLEPLDEYIAKYKDKYNLGDFTDVTIAAATYNGKIYGLPGITNTMLMAYRHDLYSAAGLEPPTTMDAYMAALAKLHSPAVTGTAMALRAETARELAHWFMNSIGDGWFDKNLRPIFNNEKGVRAIEAMKKAAAYAAPGYTSHSHEEVSILLQQGGAATSMQWLSRIAAMDNKERSRVVGLMEWVQPPGGGQPIIVDMFAISRFSTQDKDKLFQMMAEMLSPANQKGVAVFGLPTRKSVLADPELRARFRHYPVLDKSLAEGKNYPRFPEFGEVMEPVTRRVVQAVTGELAVKDALDLAAKEAEAFLERRGVYRAK